MSRCHTTPFTRRQLLGAGAAALAWLTSSRSGWTDDSRRPFGDFTVGAQSYCFRNFDTEHALKKTHDLGLHFVELSRTHATPRSSPEQVRALLHLCAEYQLTPVAFGVERFTKDHAQNQKLFDFGRQLGIRAFSADPDPDSFDSLDKLVDEHKIAIAIHPHGPQGGRRLHRWYSAELIMAAVKDHHSLIGSCLDTGHLIRAAQLGKKLDPAEQVRIMGSRNFAIHLKDHDNRLHEDVIFGKGPLDVPAVLRALRDVKFKGHISIEYEAHPENPSPDIAACLDILKDAVKHTA